MAEHWILRGRDATLKQEHLNYDVYFRTDGRWSGATLRRKLKEAAEQASAEWGFPIEFAGYYVVGDHEGGLRPMPHVERRQASRVIDGVTVIWTAMGSGRTQMDLWQVSKVPSAPGANGQAGLIFEREKSKDGRHSGHWVAIIADVSGGRFGGRNASRERALRGAIAEWKQAAPIYRTR